MSEMKWAIITGADGGMGTEITRAVAKAGYRIIMACYHPKKAEVVRECLRKPETRIWRLWLLTYLPCNP